MSPLPEDLGQLPCDGEPLRGCPVPVTYVAFFPGSRAFAPDAILLCAQHALAYAGPGPGGAPILAPVAALRPRGVVEAGAESPRQARGSRGLTG